MPLHTAVSLSFSLWSLQLFSISQPISQAVPTSLPDLPTHSLVASFPQCQKLPACLTFLPLPQSASHSVRGSGLSLFSTHTLPRSADLCDMLSLACRSLQAAYISISACPLLSGLRPLWRPVLCGFCLLLFYVAPHAAYWSAIASLVPAIELRRHRGLHEDHTCVIYFGPSHARVIGRYLIWM
jgi:hypothetical protein